jgi:membrane-bound lytic murein transglycosylase A
VPPNLSSSAATIRRSLVPGLVLVASLLASCQPQRHEPQPALPPPGRGDVHLVPIAFTQIPGWSEDAIAEAAPALHRSCERILQQGPSAMARTATIPAGSYADWYRVCTRLPPHPVADPAFRRYLEAWFTAHRIVNGTIDEGLVTGYYEPTLRGAWRPGGPFRVPLYRMPNQGTPLPTRAEIERGALAGRGLELLWVDDVIDAFFLQTQGSGRVQLTDGSTVRVGFAGKNGHSYFAIGRELVRRGVLTTEQVSMQSIRAWLVANPGEAAAVMDLNPSYVFFRILNEDGPIGAEGVVLTAGRSLAVDPMFVAYGTPVWINTTDPLSPGQPLRRLVIAQDTGGAIRGPIRGDLFWGAGSEAAQGAGRMRQSGRFILLLPKVEAGS